MILILSAIFAAALIAAVLFWYSNESYDGTGTAAAMAGMLLSLAAGVAAVAYVFMGWSWIASESKARIVNREYNTSYTREEVFYASDVIETIREINRTRVEVNGDLMREGKQTEHQGSQP